MKGGGQLLPNIQITGNSVIRTILHRDRNRVSTGTLLGIKIAKYFHSKTGIIGIIQLLIGNSRSQAVRMICQTIIG